VSARGLFVLPLLLIASACSPPSPPVQTLFDNTAIAPKQPGDAWSVLRVRDHSVEPNDIIDVIAVSDDYLFWAGQYDGIYRMPKYGGEIEVLDSGRSGQYHTLDVAGDHVYWTRENTGIGPNESIKRRGLTGGPVTTIFGTDLGIVNSSQELSFGADNHAVYFVADALNDPGRTKVSLYRVPNGGGSAAVLQTNPLASGVVLPSDRFLSFLADNGDCFVIDAADTTLSVIAADTTTPRKLADLTLDDPMIVQAADADTVYLTGGRHIYGVPRAGGALRTIYETTVATGGLWSSLLVDGTSLYFLLVDNAATSVMSVPKTGGTATRISRNDAQFAGGIDYIRQDEKNIYVLRSESEILRLPKTPTGVVE
jgi:hypothetical protein